MSRSAWAKAKRAEAAELAREIVRLQKEHDRLLDAWWDDPCPNPVGRLGIGVTGRSLVWSRQKLFALITDYSVCFSVKELDVLSALASEYR